MEIIRDLTLEDLKDFAKDNTINQMTFKGKYDNIYILTKIKFNDNIILLFGSNYLKQEQKTNEILLDENIMTNHTELEKIGFYNFKDENLYNLTFFVNWNLNIPKEKIDNTKKTSTVQEDIKNSIINKILELIDNNINNLHIKESELNNENIKKLEEYKEYYLERTIKEHFFENKTQVNLNNIITDISDKNISVIKYITLENDKEKENYILEKAKDYIKENQNEIYIILKQIELINKGLKEIYEDKDNILHKKKAILEAVKGKKTVNVTIVKNGIEFTFKTDTTSLTNKYYSWYNYLDIQAKERQKYKDLFGWKDYTSDEIKEIKYGKKVIYKAS